MSQKILVVTGGNKGIGRAIVRNLMSHPPPGYLIYLTARDPSRGETAVSELKEEVPSSPSTLLFHQLDITDETSVSSFAKFFEEKHGKKLSVLINNAGIAGKGPRFDKELVDWTFNCNYYGTKRITDALLPLLLRDGSEKPRIVNVSSTAGSLSLLPSKHLRDAFTDPKLTMERLDELIKEFEENVEKGTCQKEGWPTSAYGMSKIGMTAMSNAYAAKEKDVLINACHPGWVKTDMGGARAPMSLEDGAKTPVLLAVGDIGDKTGKFWQNERESKW